MTAAEHKPAVILFRPTYDPELNSVPTIPWALLYVAAPLLEDGVRVFLVDQAGDPDCYGHVRELLEAEDPVAVGITSMTGAQIRYGLEFARFIRKHSQAPIVWGGIHPTLKAEQTARHDLVDYVVAGEGDFAFRDLVRRLTTGGDTRGMPGLFQVVDGQVEGKSQDQFLKFAELPEPPFHLLDMERYICARPDLGVKRYSEICTSRGCVHRCSFCYVQDYHKGQWRALDADEAVKRIEAFVKQFDVDCVLFREDNFFVKRTRVERIAQGLIDRGLNIKWAASCRINYFVKYTPDFIDLLRRSGCVLLTFGVESGSDRVLEFIEKGITSDMVRQTAHMLKDSGIQGTCHFMGGFPTETPEEFLTTCRLIQELITIAPTVAPREMSVLSPFPGLPILPHCIAGGFEEPRDLEGWMDMDWWNGTDRPWLEPRQARLLEDAQFLIARLMHSNPILRGWARLRWKQMLKQDQGIALPERPVIEFLRRLRKGR